MGKPHYTEYASHAFRCYAKNQNTGITFRSEAERRDWEACEKAVKAIEPHVNWVLECYAGNLSFKENLAAVSVRYQVSQNYLWILNNALLRCFAVERGLI